MTAVRPTVEAVVTNISTGGRWIVVQTTTSRHGPFKNRADAEEFAAKLTGGGGS